MMSNNNRKPMLMMQRGTSLPVEVASCPNLAHQDNANKPYSLPLFTTSQINIQLPLQPPKPRPEYKTEVFVQAPPPVPPPPQAPPVLQRSFSTPTESRLHDLPSPSSPATRIKGLMSQLSRTDSEPDHDSLLMSSLDDSQDSRSLMSYSTHSSSAECDSACSVEGDETDLASVNPQRVAVITEGSSALMLQLVCDNDNTMDNPAFHELLYGVAQACVSYYRKKETIMVSMNGTQISQLIMSDRRPVKDHIAEISEQLSDNITISRAVGRRCTDKYFVGTYVNEPVNSKGRCTLGKAACLVTLTKRNKLSPTTCEEFSDQICHHIIAYRPSDLGRALVPKPERASKKERIRRPSCANHLLTQAFLYDPSIPVYEAARRAFVDVTDFVLYH